ncbi:glycoside hydrolase family 18 [Fusarium sporotrichioides]|uniref:Glycoside hydrolase family 18 n=1 Tax=Fusarium sporotrichioides TaxID=5514 RepID=A0A395S254_FUSSP|nr:glycoside hydrolase family 18 [Fusarium sporotrichioides]
MNYLSSFFVLVIYQLLVASHISFAAPTQERQEAIDNFKAALLDSRYNFTEKDIGETATRLFGWQGCSTSQSRAIYSGWQQSWKMMDAVQGKNLNFNEAAAFEYLAPPFINEEDQVEIKKIIDTVSTIRGGSSLNPFKWWLHVRCDDPDDRCPCGGTSTTVAYTTDKDHDSGYARINFCPRYFELDNLDETIKKNSGKDFPLEHRANLNSYIKNKGRTWFHELLHIDWASGVLPGWHIRDIAAFYRDKDGTYRRTIIYGAQRTKALARYKFSPAFFIRRNADNIAMYAMAKYVQKAIGKYPHLPVAWEFDDVEDGYGLFMSGDFSIDIEGNANIAEPQEEDDCLTDGGQEIPEQDTVPFNSSAWFWEASIYPEDYQRQLRGWIADAYPHQNRVRIVFMQTALGPQWMAFQDTPDDPITDFCSTKILSKTLAKGDEQDLKFPTELPAFDAHDAKGCVYSGTSDLRAAIFKDSPHPESAKLLHNFMFSYEHQDGTGSWSVLKNVPAPAGYPGIMDVPSTNLIEFERFTSDRVRVERLKLFFEDKIGTTQGLSPLADGM